MLKKMAFGEEFIHMPALERQRRESMASKVGDRGRKTAISELRMKCELTNECFPMRL